MARVEVNRKQPRKGGEGLFTSDDNENIFIGRDYALQNEIDETKERTQSRSCFKGCRTCGCCANSRRDASYPYSYDEKAGKMISCKHCEKFRYHDCHNGWMRTSHQDAEPFTEEAVKFFNKGGKPLI